MCSRSGQLRDIPCNVRTSPILLHSCLNDPYLTSHHPITDEHATSCLTCMIKIVGLHGTSRYHCLGSDDPHLRVTLVMNFFNTTPSRLINEPANTPSPHPQFMQTCPLSQPCTSQPSSFSRSRLAQPAPTSPSHPPSTQHLRSGTYSRTTASSLTQYHTQTCPRCTPTTRSRISLPLA